MYQGYNIIEIEYTQGYVIYYLHVLLSDLAGNKKEIISEGVNIIQLITEITINQTSISIPQGESKTLISTVLPDIISNRKVQWTSSNNNIATLANITLGRTGKDMASLEATRNDYNNVIQTLHSKAQTYLNTDYASVARCIGSVPSNPTSEASGYFTSTEPYMSKYNGTFKEQDWNFNEDWNQMVKLGIESFAGQYCIPSRYWISSSTQTSFAMRSVNSENVWNGGGVTIRSDGTINCVAITSGFKPVFTLKSEIKVTGGNGTRYNPWQLSI